MCKACSAFIPSHCSPVEHLCGPNRDKPDPPVWILDPAPSEGGPCWISGCAARGSYVENGAGAGSGRPGDGGLRRGTLRGRS